MENGRFLIEAWKKQEIKKVNNRFNGQAFRATAMQQTYNSQEQRLTLADGTVIITPEGDNWVGKTITLEDGSPLPPGEYTLAGSMHSSGRVLVIGEDGNVAKIREPLPDKGVKNSFEPMNAAEIIHGWKTSELKKHNGNGAHFNMNAMPQTLSPKRRIQLLEAKIEELKRFLKK